MPVTVNSVPSRQPSFSSVMVSPTFMPRSVASRSSMAASSASAGSSPSTMTGVFIVSSSERACTSTRSLPEWSSTESV